MELYEIFFEEETIHKKYRKMKTKNLITKAILWKLLLFIIFVVCIILIIVFSNCKSKSVFQYLCILFLSAIAMALYVYNLIECLVDSSDRFLYIFKDSIISFRCKKQHKRYKIFVIQHLPSFLFPILMLKNLSATT